VFNLKLELARESRPAHLDILSVGFLEAFGRSNSLRSLIMVATFVVAGMVQPE